MKSVQMIMMNKPLTKVYGYLYNWFALANIAATGWHVPTDAEFTNLTNLLGGESGAGGKLKSTRTSPLEHPRWNTPNTGATDEVNFSALSGGYRVLDGRFSSIGSNGVWWSATEFNATYLWYRFISYNTSNVSRYYNNKKLGYSVRLCRELISGEELLTDGTYVADYVGNDLKTYKAVKIGSLVWTAENLAETLYNDLSPIPNVTDNTEWSVLTTGARCAYDNNEDYV